MEINENAKERLLARMAYTFCPHELQFQEFEGCNYAISNTLDRCISCWEYALSKEPLVFEE